MQVAAQFGRFDAKKKDREYAARALGYWPLEDAYAYADGPRLSLPPAAAETPGPKPRPHEPRSPEPQSSEPKPPEGPPLRVSLDARVWAATAEHSSLHSLLNAMSLLSLVAAVVDAVPTIPSVPCASRWLLRHPRAFASVSDGYVLQLPLPNQRCARRRSRIEAPPDALECHLSLGGERCSAPSVLPAWQAARECTHHLLPTRTFRLETIDGEGLWRALRAEKARNASLLEVQLEGRLERALGGERPWTVSETGLTAEEATRLAALRRTCPGYFGVERRRLHGKRLG